MGLTDGYVGSLVIYYSHYLPGPEKEYYLALEHDGGEVSSDDVDEMAELEEGGD